MSKHKAPTATAQGQSNLATNRKALHKYHLIERFETGIVLTGSEIKSIRNAGANIEESYVRVKGNELIWVGARINQYSHTYDPTYEAARDRKLLMHRREIDRLVGRVEMKGLTIVPLRLYLKQGRAKLEIALAKGKDAPDKRQSIKEREQRIETQRAIKGR